MNYEWGILVGLYLFVAGVAGGAYFVAAISELFGNERDRKVADIGYPIAFLMIIIGALLITLDLGNPDRVWRLFSILNIQSPMSIGAWSIFVFGIFAFLNMAMAISTSERFKNTILGKLGGFISPAKKVITWIGIVVASYLVLYTGVLLGVTSQVLWTSTYLLGALFMASGVSTGIAAISLIAGGKEELRESIRKLEKADKRAIIVEVAILSLLIIALYFYGTEPRLALSRLIGGTIGIFFWIGVVILGLVLPLLSLLKRERAPAITNIMMFFILIGGFVMRYVLLIAGQI
ncbi:MAG: polysulfide reductase NrfD [Nitrospirae bacterium]|nr:polysulfide reductase NrfD [Nitrospirota bacterium]